MMTADPAMAAAAAAIGLDPATGAPAPMSVAVPPSLPPTPSAGAAHMAAETVWMKQRIEELETKMQALLDNVERMKIANAKPQNFFYGADDKPPPSPSRT